MTNNIAEKVSYHQFLMTKAYAFWQSEEGKDMSRKQFLKAISPIEKVAVQLGNFNYQVNNGGFGQWVLNHYYVDIDDLISYAEMGIGYGLKSFKEILPLLEEFKDIPEHESWEEEEDCSMCDGTGEVYDDWEEEHVECDECYGCGYYTVEHDNYDEIDLNYAQLDSDYYKLGEEKVMEDMNNLLLIMNDIVGGAK